MSSKKKSKHQPSLSAPDLIKLAQDQLQRGQAQNAVESLRSAEAKLKQASTAPPGKKISIPPHIVAALDTLPALFSRALYMRSLLASDSGQQIADLEEAAKRDPDNHRLVVARGAARLIASKPEAAYVDFQRADEMHPGDALSARAFAIGLLATGREREAKALLDRTPPGERDAKWQRLAALSEMPLDGETNTNQPSLLFSGLAYLINGENRTAAEKLATLPALDHNPSRAEAAELATQFFYNGALNFSEQRYQAAMGDFSEALRLAESHSIHLPWRKHLVAYLHKMAESVIAENLPLALQCWQQALKLSPDDKAAQANLSTAKRARAQIAWRDGKTQDAIALWLEALEAKPHDEGLLRSLAIAYEKLDCKADALPHWRALGRLWRQQFKNRSSESGFKDRLLRLEQHVIKLMIETELSPNEIANELEAAIKFDPENPELRRLVADHLMEIDKPNLALKHLEVIERQQGASAVVLVRKGIAYDMLERYGDALKTFEKAREMEPDNAIARATLLTALSQEASRCLKRNKIDQAVEACKKQLSIDPNYIPAIGQLASIHFSRKEKAEGKAMMKRYLATGSDTAQKRVQAGDIYLEHGFQKEARAEFKKAIEIEPSAECYFHIGECYWENEHDRSAIKYFDLAAEKAGVDLLLAMAVTCAQGSDMKHFDRYIEKAISLDPAHPLPYAIRGMSILMTNPIALLIAPTLLQGAIKDLKEAERLAVADPRFASLLPELREARRTLENPPQELTDLFSLGPPPFDFEFEDEEEEDDDDDFVFFEPRRRKKRRK